MDESARVLVPHTHVSITDEAQRILPDLGRDPCPTGGKLGNTIELGRFSGSRGGSFDVRPTRFMVQRFIRFLEQAAQGTQKTTDGSRPALMRVWIIRVEDRLYFQDSQAIDDLCLQS